MDLYDRAAYSASRRLTVAHSTSFSKSITLFDALLQPHIYAIYGLVRIADEVVDTYKGNDKEAILNELEAETYAALNRGYSANLIVHACALTARKFGISRDLIEPFFASMRMDLSPHTYTEELYKTYIYGSAEVVGLMCLRVFVAGDDARYKKLTHGARALGSAYQKVNFLRDMSADHNELHRMYFPGVQFDTFQEEDKHRIVSDIKKEVEIARAVLSDLPASCRYAVELSLRYYSALLDKIEKTSVDELKRTRIRVSDVQKAILLAGTHWKRGVRRG